MPFWGYVEADPARSVMLVEMVKECGIEEPRILELGCNVGRNLEHLRRAGFTNLAGIDINPDTIAGMKVHYPELNANIVCGTIEEAVRNTPDDSYDIVFTMAVLMHIHPSSDWIFEEVVRITKRNLIVVENELAETTGEKAGLINARDYGEIFTSLGMQQTAIKNVGNACGITAPDKPYIARVFKQGLKP